MALVIRKIVVGDHANVRTLFNELATLPGASSDYGPSRTLAQMAGLLTEQRRTARIAIDGSPVGFLLTEASAPAEEAKVWFVTRSLGAAAAKAASLALLEDWLSDCSWRGVALCRGRFPKGSTGAGVMALAKAFAAAGAFTEESTATDYIVHATPEQALRGVRAVM